MISELATAAVEFVKLAPRYLAPVAVVAGVLLFLPQQQLEVMGVAELAKDHRPVVGLTFLFCAAVTLVGLVQGVYGFFAGGWTSRRFKRRVRERLQRLTEDEKQILRFYLSQQTRANVLRIDDGVVQGLVAAGIIFRSTNVGNIVEGFAHNIGETAWEYLHEHPAVLVGSTNYFRTDKDKLWN